MNELEQQLIDLGSALEIPEAPDLMAAVRGRLPSRPARRIRRPTLGVRRRSVLLGISLAVVLAGTAVAIPPVRHAIERVFGINGAVVERVPQLPALPNTVGAKLHLGRRIPVSDARHAASFTALVPSSGVSAAYVANDVAGGRVSLTAGRLLVTEFRGTSRPFILKLIAVGTRAIRTRVGGEPAVYLEGAPHEVFFLDAHGQARTDDVRLAGNVLLWQRGPLTLRIEGARSLDDALALARSLR
ncbi:MAG TPA: hypothetical protein VFI54_06950 [Solirubrobacteraceae bacterium]|nr:hypothetical protein [Solirubrobacteraceae bacterium]